MVLDHVANGAGLIVESAASLHSEILRHGDLHAFNVVAIPERLHERIGEAENDHVVHRPLAEIVIDAKDRGLGKDACRIRLSSCAEARSWPNGFSTMTRAPSAQPDFASCSTTVANRTGGMAR